MNLSHVFLSEFEYEMANTRKALERCPEGQFGWKPHEKSFTLGQLASHLANIPSWVEVTLNQDLFNFTSDYKSVEAGTTKELLAEFDKNVEAAKKAFTGYDESKWHQLWTLQADGKTIFSMPRAAVLRGFVLNHGVHHRGQLTVYLRLLGAPVPALYGPSADEQGM